MSSVVEAQPQPGVVVDRNFTLWKSQVVAIMRLEVKKNFWGKRAFLIYLMAAFPVAIIFALTQLDTRAASDISRYWGEAKIIYANVFEGLVLRTVVFFGCAWIFMNLFRGEIVDKSLHYYFLAPLRREVLLVGKYISGLVVSSVLFGLTTLLTLFFLYLAKGYPANIDELVYGRGGGEVLAYLGTTIFACAGYGAFFLVVGLFFRNPIIPSLIAYGLEWINFLLPPVLKRISVIHYLHSLMPVPVSQGPFAMVSEPSPVWIAVPGLIITVTLVLIVAAYRIRKLEIRYGND